MAKRKPALFKGRHFEAEIIILCVRWYLRFALSLRDLEERMAERNLHVDHVTIWRWVQRYAPELGKRCRRELRMTNRSWRVDETYLRIAGKWTYLYRAVDSTGATIDFLLSVNRDADAAPCFFQKALRSRSHPRPRVINVDGNPSYPRVISALKTSGPLVGGGADAGRWSKTIALSSGAFEPAKASDVSPVRRGPSKESR